METTAQRLAALRRQGKQNTAQRLAALRRQGDTSAPRNLSGQKSRAGSAPSYRQPEPQQTKALALPLGGSGSNEKKKNRPSNIMEFLTTPAESGYFEGVSFLPSSPQEFWKGLGYYAERSGAGLLGLVENITDLGWLALGEGLHGALTLGGLLPETENSQWAKSLGENALSGGPTQAWKESINERYQPGIGAQRLGNIAETVAQMLPALGVGTAVSAGTSALNTANAASKGAAASKAVFGLNAAGAGANEAAAEGASTGQALGYGSLSGLLETSIESLAGGIPGLGKGVLSQAADKANPLVTRALDVAGEGGEEALSTILTPYIKRAVYDADARNATADEIAESAAMGMAAAGILQGGLALPTAMSQAMDTRRDAGAYALPTYAQQKTASQKQAGTYRAELPQNVELPTVPIINLSMDDVAALNGGTLPQAGNSLRKAAISRARTRLGLDENPAAYIPASNVMRNGDEYVLKITKSSLNKMLSPADGNVVQPESIAVLNNIERIANNGVWFEGQGDRKGRQQINGIDHLKTTVYIDGTPYEVDMRVRLVQENANTPQENVLYYFTPEEIVTIEKAGTVPPTGERRALTGASEGVPASSSFIIAGNTPKSNTQFIPDTPEPPRGGRPLPLPAGIDSPSGGAYNETTGQAAKPLPKANVPETVEVADWAKGHLVDRPSPAASRAASHTKQYVPDVFVVENAAIKGLNPEAWAVTSNGKVYISDAVPAYLADAVGYHEVVHCLKHRREPRYMEFLDEVGWSLNNQAEATKTLLDLVMEGRSIYQDFIELDNYERKIVCDEINAIVWGYYKDDPENARAQFAQMFRDYDAYIQKLDAIVEASRSG